MGLWTDLSWKDEETQEGEREFSGSRQPGWRKGWFWRCGAGSLTSLVLKARQEVGTRASPQSLARSHHSDKTCDGLWGPREPASGRERSGASAGRGLEKNYLQVIFNVHHKTYCECEIRVHGPSYHHNAKRHLEVGLGPEVLTSKDLKRSGFEVGAGEVSGGWSPGHSSAFSEPHSSDNAAPRSDTL